ncbi:DUF11 domain-containing protein [Patescibacteria group bacterium]|nr:DUF11 domain-containing protein [Patescibacteria group bacterium]
MPDFKDKEKMESLRGRLYERGQDAAFISARHSLSRPQSVDVARGWASTAPVAVVESVPVQHVAEATPADDQSAAEAKNPRRYRSIILLVTTVLFVLTVGTSSVYLFFGGNQISGKNIDFVLTGPLAVAGGDIVTLQVAVNNNNAVAIEGATLVVNYPSGTKSIGEGSRDLFEERIPLETIAAGESKVIPIQVAVFGEENEGKEITAAIDYRVTGSNGTFYKEAEPVKFTINSSPVILRVESVEKISAGQEFEIKLSVLSNAKSPLSNVLISAAYPDSFRFVSAKPEPSYRQSEWTLKELAAGETQTITIRGVGTGLSSEAFIVRFQAGTPRTDNQFMIGSVLAQTASTFTVEQPFVDMQVRIGNDTDNDVVLPAGGATDVVVVVTNTHSEPIYDMNLRVVPAGSAFNESLLRINAGFYDSLKKELRFEVSGSPELALVQPGEKREFRFTLSGDTELRTATLDLAASVYGRRVSERNVPEVLIGAAETSVRYSSVATLAQQIDHLSGPVPPTVNEETLYTLTLEATAGANDVTGARVVTTLPQYVGWLAAYNGPGEVSFNPINKELSWNIGEVKSSERKVLSFQVSFTPSVLQVDTVPVMMNRQVFEATDRFTGARLSTDAPPITTQLSEEQGYDRDNGIVVNNGGE